MMIVTGSITAEAHSIDELFNLSLEHVRRSRAEPGCISHNVHRDEENPLRLIFFEEWKDKEALSALMPGYLLKAAHKVIDGNQALSEVTARIVDYLNSDVLSPHLKINLDKNPWPVSFGTLLTDNGWHPLKDGDLKDWCKAAENTAVLQAGDELKGNTFTYRQGTSGAGQYEVRLNGWCNIFTYSNKPTRELGRY
jgi:quinol monooxygenase YgiN